MPEKYCNGCAGYHLLVQLQYMISTRGFSSCRYSITEALKNNDLNNYDQKYGKIWKINDLLCTCKEVRSYLYMNVMTSARTATKVSGRATTNRRFSEDGDGGAMEGDVT